MTIVEAQGSGDQLRTWKPILHGWTLQRDQIAVPAAVDDSWEGPGYESFDGIGTYRRRLELPSDSETSDGRWIVEISGVATAATVRLDGTKVAEHLGGWTPFRVDVTDWLTSPSRESDAQGPLLEIEVDERVGHNTQGFLPIVVPHFGGIWKGVRVLHTKGPAYLDDMTLLLAGYDGSDTIHLEAQVRGGKEVDAALFEIGYRITGPSDDVTSDWRWIPVQPPGEVQISNPAIDASGTDRLIGAANAAIAPPRIRRWSPQSPFQYEVEIALRETSSDRIVDRLERRASIRRFETDGRKLLINGKPVKIRGILNWGYAPPRLAPTLDEAVMRRELEFARRRGFNLMKFCLWTPPRRYLELADEMGMLTWIEYPTWHPDFSERHSEDLTTEFAELFYYDRNTAGAILRSLTCETGQGASIDVVRQLYQLGHRMIPGAIIEDDSSWISWQRIHDFYDDHPYGNNESWLTKLGQLDEYIEQREPKPLVLGEAIAADTWEPAERNGVPLDPPHASLSASKQPDYLRQLLDSHALKDASSLRRDSLRAAHQMRKYQIEAFRWRLPDAGYVVSVIRDFPKASMGLVDRWGNPKWDEDDFTWHGPIQLVLENGQLQRSLRSDEKWDVRVGIVGEGQLPEDLALTLKWSNDKYFEQQTGEVSYSVHDRPDKAAFETTLTVPSTQLPTPLTLRAELRSRSEVVAENQWRLWLVPARQTGKRSSDSPAIYISSAIAPERRTQLGLDDIMVIGGLPDAINAMQSGTMHPVIVASRFDQGLLDAIRKGARCVMLPDGKPGSFLIRPHWFLRGGPVVADHALTSEIDRTFFVDLQTFDLASTVLIDFPLQNEGTPIVSLWDNHDLDYYRTHALLWESQIEEGRLIVSAFNHQTSPAGKFLLRRLLQRAGDPGDAQPMSDRAIESLHRQINQRQISLSNQQWRFRPGKPSESDTAQKVDFAWLNESTATNAWSDIDITRHWDGQGYGSLDGWGLYQTNVTIPQDWRSDQLYLSFTGVDDYFEVFIDGEKHGSGGDLLKRETAFELRKSFPVNVEATKDGVLDIRVQVYDWQGAGGIFRPVYLSTEPMQGGPSWIVR